MARQKKMIDDEDWPEVNSINNYAIFMGCLLMGVRGLGLLVLTWTTVVLLGGFVSILHKEDFWSLTAITLVQTAGVFDLLFLEEKVSDVGNALVGFMAAGAVMKPFKEDTNTNTFVTLVIVRFVVWLFLSLIQLLVFAIVLCPLAVLYMLGMYLSAGISLWRLIQHDYDGNPDGGSNLTPALNVLYSLAVAQGVVYGYWMIYDSAGRTGLVEAVAKEYSLEPGLVSEYLGETVEGCLKDPSFARGRNLVTYAVDLMESKSRYGYISGILILGAILQMRLPCGQPGLIKQLLTGSASFSYVVQRLVETFGPTNRYSTEIRLRAAVIVESVAGSIRLDQFPQGMMIEYISSVLDTSEDGQHWHQVAKEYERGWLLDEVAQWNAYCKRDKIPRAMTADSRTQESGNGSPLQGYKGLVVQGLRILQKLAINEDNCRVMSNTEGLLSKTMAPLIPDELHGDHHDEWSIIAVESLEFLNQLMATLGGGTETTNLTSEISSNSQVIMRTLGCHKCKLLLKRQAAEVLLYLSPDTLPSIVTGASGSRSNIMLVWMMLEMFLLPEYHFVRRMHGATHLSKKSSYTSRLAGEKMQGMMLSSKTEASETSMLPSVVGDVVGSLARAVAGAESNAHTRHAATALDHLCRSTDDADAENNTYFRIRAVAILKHLVRYYTKDDENLKELKKAVAEVMPLVLKEIVNGPTTDETQVVTEANNGRNVLLTDLGLDIEAAPLIRVKHDIPHLQKGGIQLQALLDLCDNIKKAWIGKDQDLTHHFNEIAANICLEQRMPHKSFESILKGALGKLEEDKWGVAIYKKFLGLYLGNGRKIDEIRQVTKSVLDITEVDEFV